MTYLLLINFYKKKYLFCIILLMTALFYSQSTDLRINSMAGLTPNGFSAVPDFVIDSFYYNPAYSSLVKQSSYQYFCHSPQLLLNIKKIIPYKKIILGYMIEKTNFFDLVFFKMKYPDYQYSSVPNNFFNHLSKVDIITAWKISDNHTIGLNNQLYIKSGIIELQSKLGFSAQIDNYHLLLGSEFMIPAGFYIIKNSFSPSIYDYINFTTYQLSGTIPLTYSVKVDMVNDIRISPEQFLRIPLVFMIIGEGNEMTSTGIIGFKAALAFTYHYANLLMVYGVDYSFNSEYHSTRSFHSHYYTTESEVSQSFIYDDYDLYNHQPTTYWGAEYLINDHIMLRWGVKSQFLIKLITRKDFYSLLNKASLTKVDIVQYFIQNYFHTGFSIGLTPLVRIDFDAEFSLSFKLFDNLIIPNNPKVNNVFESNFRYGINYEFPNSI